MNKERLTMLIFYGKDKIREHIYYKTIPGNSDATTVNSIYSRSFYNVERVFLSMKSTKVANSQEMKNSLDNST